MHLHHCMLALKVAYISRCCMDCRSPHCLPAYYSAVASPAAFFAVEAVRTGMQVSQLAKDISQLVSASGARKVELDGMLNSLDMRLTSAVGMIDTSLPDQLQYLEGIVSALQSGASDTVQQRNKVGHASANLFGTVLR